MLVWVWFTVLVFPCLTWLKLCLGVEEGDQFACVSLLLCPYTCDGDIFVAEDVVVWIA